MSTIFFIADTHFGHANILNFLNDDGKHVRDFISVEEMDEAMVDNWNRVVKPQDKVYHLGDVAMKRYALQTVARLNGHLKLVRGNHDIYDTEEYLEYFDDIYGCRVLDRILFTHIPIHPGNMGKFKLNVHGHIHERTLEYPYLNVSVERINYTPVSLDEIKCLM